MGKLFNRGREKRKREEKVKVGKLFKDGEKEKGEEKTRSGEDFQRGREKRKGGRNDISRK